MATLKPKPTHHIHMSNPTFITLHKPQMTFTRQSLANFALEYTLQRDAEVFTFQGQEYFPVYARYLIEYLAWQLGMRFQIDAAGFIELGTN